MSIYVYQHSTQAALNHADHNRNITQTVTLNTPITNEDLYSFSIHKWTTARLPSYVTVCCIVKTVCCNTVH
jgi:hypothetical protein